MQILEPHPRPTESEPLGVGPDNLCFKKPPVNSDKHTNLKTTGI